jgi:hypothetical protein
MRKLLLLSLLSGALSLVTFVPRGTTAPALGDKPVRYEYAELSYGRTAPAQPQLGGGGRGGGQFGGGGNAPGLVTIIRWTTGEEEVEVQEWSELGDKLKAPPPKKESPQGVHRLRVLNKLSADGWEMLDRPLGESRAFSGTGWSFRRRVP